MWSSYLSATNMGQSAMTPQLIQVKNPSIIFSSFSVQQLDFLTIGFSLKKFNRNSS
jgi:hypothetical protein